MSPTTDINNNTTKRTLLDRSLVPLLPRKRPRGEAAIIGKTIKNDDDKKTNDAHGSADKNKNDDNAMTPHRLHQLHHLHGASLIRAACRILFSADGAAQQQQPTAESFATESSSSEPPPSESNHNNNATSLLGTASVMFHRYLYHTYHDDGNGDNRNNNDSTNNNNTDETNNPAAGIDIWSTALASLVIAAKAHEVPLPLPHVVVVLSHLFRKRRLFLIDPPNETTRDESSQVSATTPSTTTITKATERYHQMLQLLQRHGWMVGVNDDAPLWPREASWPSQQKLAFLQDVAPVNNALSNPAYQEWHPALINAEHSILRRTGFSLLHWIPHTALPHKYVAEFVKRVLGDHKKNSNDHPIHQTAWNYCNDSFLLHDICLHIPASITAAAAVYLACLQAVLLVENDNNGTKDNETRQNPLAFFEANPNWAALLCGKQDDDATNNNDATGTEQLVAQTANALLGLQQVQDEDDGNQDGNHKSNDNITATRADLALTLCGYCPSASRTAVNGPDSFLWDLANTQAAQFEQANHHRQQQQEQE